MKIAAVEDGGQIHVSHDAGLTWTAQAFDQAWWGVASSANGDKLVAAALVPAQPLYTSRTSTAHGTAGFLQGASGSTLALKYLGHGVFEVITSTGDITAGVGT